MDDQIIQSTVETTPNPNPGKGSVLLVLVSVLLTAVVSVTATYLWLGQTKPSPAPQQVVVPPNQTTNTDKVQKLTDALVYAWFQEQIASTQILDFVQDQNNKNLYYYSSVASYPTSQLELFSYDLSKDSSFATELKPDFANFSTRLYQENIEPESWVKLAGVYGGKLVFYYGQGDDSPGPCAEPFLSPYYTFHAFDLNSRTAMKDPYKPSTELIAQKKKAQDSCAQDVIVPNQ